MRRYRYGLSKNGLPPVITTQHPALRFADGAPIVASVILLQLSAKFWYTLRRMPILLTFRSALATYLFLIPLFVMVLAEFAKIVSEWVMTGAWHKRIFRYGGLPSSHSAFVASLLIVVGNARTIASAEFAIAAVFASIVWYDAVAVRGAVSKQSKVLNSLQDFYEFSEEIGHSLVEVIAGILFGIVVTMLGLWIVY
ncbi:hypothetical protein COU80_02160 [Candidatus Peregrinibacteria bacterium CG10_big_fil_rev_8_21_14_0_10_55_24]|nr:MAG: hypothetical protein COU80_02160 [Candidatus Peregrinibacteria bacterium CG10_big_fil_rev_8_21_14_0_10_55_24]